MKKYKLKEEVKKYLTLHDENKFTLDQWESHNVTIEALEEVEERVIVQLYATHYEHVFLSKRKDEHSNQIGWTEQEREDIEKFLNVFGSWEDMATRIDETMANWGAIPNDYRHFFDELLKEQGCDKK